MLTSALDWEMPATGYSGRSDIMDKIAVVFPGVGYTKDRPLLYYAGKLAVKKGYELIHMDFSGIDWSKEKLKDRNFMRETVLECLRRTKEKIGGINPQTEPVFISKSIGTVVATAYASQNGLNAKHICFSPLEEIGDYISKESGILFYADADPFADYKAIEKIRDKKNLTAYDIQGGNHSLETGDVIKDIKNLNEIMTVVDKFLS